MIIDNPKWLIFILISFKKSQLSLIIRIGDSIYTFSDEVFARN